MSGDDGPFKERLECVLPSGWGELSPRQKRRFVVNFRRNQNSWRAEIPGEFQEAVHNDLGQARWRIMSEAGKRRFWNMWRYQGQEDYDRNCSSTVPDLPPRMLQDAGRGQAHGHQEPRTQVTLLQGAGRDSRSPQREEARRQHKHHRGVPSDDF